ncbi:MAG: class I SAM-dependent methyltransferase [Thermoplasmatota archaeon]
MKDAERASKTFDKIAEHFDKTRNRPWDVVVEFLDERSGLLLDLGCGNGRHTKVASKSGLSVVGLDASHRLLKIARDKSDKGVDMIRGGFKSLPFKNGCFDHVIFIASLHHLRAGRVDALREVKRVMKQGGGMLVSSWARELDRWDIGEEERDIIVPWHREDGEVVSRFYHLYMLPELKEDVIKSGLKVIDAFRDRGNNYVKAVKK